MTDLKNLRIFVCASPIKMNLSFDRLLGLAQELFDQDPLSGHLFLFFNRQQDRMKILFWDADEFCIWYKRLEVGQFNCPLLVDNLDESETENQRFLTCVVNALINNVQGEAGLLNSKLILNFSIPSFMAVIYNHSASGRVFAERESYGCQTKTRFNKFSSSSSSPTRSGHSTGVLGK